MGERTYPFTVGPVRESSQGSPPKPIELCVVVDQESISTPPNSERNSTLLHCRPTCGNLPKLLRVIEIGEGTGNHHWLEWVISPMPTFCKLVLQYHGICRRCTTLSRLQKSEVTVRLLFPGQTQAKGFVRELWKRARHFQPKLLSIRLAQPESALTTRQREVLIVAHRLGFYSIPRRAGLRLIARELGISPSTLSVTLRRAEHKVILESAARRWHSSQLDAILMDSRDFMVTER